MEGVGVKVVSMRCQGARETLANLEVAEAIGYLPSIEEPVRQRVDHLIGTLVPSGAPTVGPLVMWGYLLRREMTRAAVLVYFMGSASGVVVAILHATAAGGR